MTAISANPVKIANNPKRNFTYLRNPLTDAGFAKLEILSKAV